MAIWIDLCVYIRMVINSDVINHLFSSIEIRKIIITITCVSIGRRDQFKLDILLDRVEKVILSHSFACHGYQPQSSRHRQ